MSGCNINGTNSSKACNTIIRIPDSWIKSVKMNANDRISSATFYPYCKSLQPSHISVSKQQNVEKLGKLPSDVENLLTFPTRSKFVKKFQNGVSDDKTSHIFLNILSHGGNRVEGEG